LIFLGDLFDGGREWATYSSESPEQRYKRYGEEFWLREYGRFGRIFFDHWGDGGMSPGDGQRGRKIIASLPGNHDLGLGVGIQPAVRERFNAYFGDGNRVDVIGNHTFVSVDVVSLSAKDQPGTEAVNPEDRARLWRPVEEFLDGVQAAKRRAVAAEIRHQNGRAEGIRHEHVLTDVNDPTISTKPSTLDPGEGSPEFPTILLTHVPLYRPGGTPCGPLREHWPPSPPPKGQTVPLEHDERNAIPIRQGYQYQNVLQPEISKDLVEKVGNVGYVFSGDDHDYCDVLHKRYTGSPLTGAIREITVKSISWAMGVRKPGFLLLSLWNPVDGNGNPMNTKDGGGEPGRKTVETRLCLLPDQLAIFIRYAILLGITVSAILARSLLVAFFDILEPFTEPATIPTYAADDHLLPTSELPPSFLSSAEHEKSSDRHPQSHPYFHSQTSSDSSTTSNPTTIISGLSVRNPASRSTRSGSSSPGYGIPLPPPLSLSRLGDPDAMSPTYGREPAFRSKGRRRRAVRAAGGKGGLLMREIRWGLWRVAWVVLVWYGWLIWRG
jgi:ethanolamine phosphate phosphodiesterase